MSNLPKYKAITEPQTIPSKLFGSSAKLSRKFSSGGSQLSQVLPASRPVGTAKTALGQQRPRCNSDGSNSLSKASLEDLFLDDNSSF
ncbi:hypothetical protein EON65_19995 [archaeon]|nr:MAG: hypothetical protein EON65_19995 [archaeon]